MKNFYLLLLTTLTLSLQAYASGGCTGTVVPCSDANPFCTSNSYNFPNETSTCTPSGPNYGCLSTTPNPVWYYMEVDVSGSFQINLAQSTGPNGTGSGLDVDFALYGPFSSLTSGCASVDGGASPIQCSYSTAATETLGIGLPGGVPSTTPASAIAGQIYIVLITNYDGGSGYISFNQTGGTGVADCSIVTPCDMTALTATPSACTPATGLYNLTGSVTFVSAPSSGTLTVTNSCGGSQTFNAPFTSPLAYSIPNQTANGASCTVTATFSADNTCTRTATYTAPAPCSATCAITGVTATPSSCLAGNTYDVSGNIAFTNPPASGTLTVSNSCGGSQVFNAPFTSPLAYSLNSLTANGSSCTVTASFSASACSSTQTYTAPAVPTPSAGVDQTVCAGTAVTLNGSGATSYTWTGGVTNGTAFTPAATSSYTVTGTNASGCTGTDVVLVTVNPIPSVNPNPDLTFCNGTSVSATSFTSTPAGATFNWSNSNTAIGLAASGTTSQPTFTGTNSGTAPISGNVTVTPTLAGCVGSTDVYQITVNPTPVIPVPANITQCGGNVSPAVFTSTTAGTTFAWTNSNTAIGLGASGTGSIATFVGTNPGSTPLSGTISVTPTANTCPGTPVNFTITINPTPVITPIADIVDCENVNIPSTVVNVTPASANVTWSNTNTSIGLGANGIGNIPAFLSTNATANPLTGTITVNASANGCNAVAETFDITINQLPTVDPVAAITQCHNTSINAVNFTSPTPGVTFDWTNSNPSIGLGASGTGALPSFTATNPTTTQATGTITVTPTLGTCVGSPITFSITVNPLPVPTAQNNGPLCPGDALNLTSTGLAGSSYSWTGPNGFVSGVQNPTIASVSTINGGVYTVTSTLNGCSGTASTSLTVNPSVIPTITQAGPFCSDGSVILLQASIPGGTWSGTGIVNPATGQFAPSSAAIGNNVITYTVNVACAVAATSTIVINPLPTVQFSAPIQSGCSPFTAVFTDNTVPASASLNWDFGDGSNGTQTGSVNHTFTNTGCYDITLTSTSNDGCVASLTLNNYICVNPYADASFTVGNPVHTLIDPEFEMINNSTDASSYSWDFGDGTTSSIVNPTHEYPGVPGTYVIMLAANNASNCPDTAYLTVVVEDQLIFHVPNSFTPDGDEFNNMFEPVFYSGFDPQSYTLLIYDRWGEILFESHNVEQGWNGTYHDGIVKEGTYVWFIQFKDSMSDKKRTYNGHVTLLK